MPGDPKSVKLRNEFLDSWIHLNAYAAEEITELRNINTPPLGPACAAKALGGLKSQMQSGFEK